MNHTGSKKNTRNNIINVLSSNWPLSAKEIFDSVKDKDGKLTYQAVHKMCNELVSDKLLLKDKRKYQLNPDWISKQFNFFNQLSVAYQLEEGELSLNDAKDMQIKQMKRKSILPSNEYEVSLHLMEEVGEISEIIRKGYGKNEIDEEIMDILWQINKLCWLRGIDMEKLFLKLLKKNKKR